MSVSEPPLPLRYHRAWPEVDVLAKLKRSDTSTGRGAGFIPAEKNAETRLHMRQIIEREDKWDVDDPPRWRRRQRLAGQDPCRRWSHRAALAVVGPSARPDDGAADGRHLWAAAA
jgi:hypothetical protein